MEMEAAAAAHRGNMASVKARPRMISDSCCWWPFSAASSGSFVVLSLCVSLRLIMHG